MIAKEEGTHGGEVNPLEICEGCIGNGRNAFRGGIRRKGEGIRRKAGGIRRKAGGICRKGARIHWKGGEIHWKGVGDPLERIWRSMGKDGGYIRAEGIYGKATREAMLSCCTLLASTATAPGPAGLSAALDVWTDAWVAAYLCIGGQAGFAFCAQVTRPHALSSHYDTEHALTAVKLLGYRTPPRQVPCPARGHTLSPLSCCTLCV
eukprot:364442-Chlamydomonas_euryale.AAC.4